MSTAFSSFWPVTGAWESRYLSAPLSSHLAAVASAIAALALVDHLVVKPFVLGRAKKLDEKVVAEAYPAQKDPAAAKKEGKKSRDWVSTTRWFLMHAIANALVVATGLRALGALLCDPVNALDSRVYSDTSFFGNASAWPLTFINAIHIYHMIGGFSLSGADYFHHLLFIPLLGFPGQVLQWGATEPAGALFISGLPGGISYLLLGLQKLGLIEPIVEKRVTANLNMWLRTPGILLSSFVQYQGLITGRHTLPLWAPAIHVLLPPYNAIYYAKQAVANYTVHFLTHVLKQDELVSERLKEHSSAKRLYDPFVGGGGIKGWHELIAVPQRGC